MPVVELREHRQTEISGPTPAEVRAMLAAVPSSRGEYLGGGRWALTGGHHVGFLRVGAYQVHIHPKVELRSLPFLLSHATDRLAWRDEDVAVAVSPHPVDAMAHLLAEAALRATRRGALQGYRRRDEALAVVRGRWRVADQVRAHQGRSLPAEVSYDDYTDDIQENRVVATALRHVRRLVVDVGARRHVGRALVRFAEHVRSLPRSEWSVPPSIDWHPLNHHYRNAVELAHVLLAGSAISHRAGEIAAHGVLVDMNDLFERFVRRSLRAELGGVVRKARRSEFALDLDRRIGVVPDVIWVRDGTTALVIDVKYKDFGSRASDLYQMHAYCAALDAPRGLLVHATAGEVTRYRLVDGRAVSIVGIDLSGSPDDIAAGVRAVAHEARSLVDQ